jgi:hypothetical protein
MAVITTTRIPSSLQKVDYLAWMGLTTGDTGKPMESSAHSDKTVQVLGNFGTNANVTMQGSNVAVPSENDDDWITLTDTTETDLVFTAKSGAIILQNYRWIRPKVTGGTTPALDIYITAKKG